MGFVVTARRRSAGLHIWWNDRPMERFWLEVTDRLDIGANLKAPQRGEKNQPFWSYSLMKRVREGDTVFHYDKNEQAIVAASRAIGEVWEDELIWGARGTSARAAGVTPHPRPGWYLGLEPVGRLEVPIELGRIRQSQSRLAVQLRKLKRVVGRPLYFPFEITSARPLRPMQGYLFKLPKFFVDDFPSLRELASSSIPSITIGDAGGSAPYRRADEETSVGTRDPFSVDPTLVERALRSHASTQNALADHVSKLGASPRSPTAHEPNFDLAWDAAGLTWVAEVKSLTHANEEKQLRLGLGQVLRCRQLLSSTNPIRCALVIERRPHDLGWESLCREHDVLLVWPDRWREPGFDWGA